MKKFKERCGAALLEVMISIAMLGLLMVPISSGILMSFRINQRSDEIMQARLAVSSAVETIMAVGVENYDEVDLLTVTCDPPITDSAAYRTVTVTHDKYPDIYVTTCVRDSSVRAGGGA